MTRLGEDRIVIQFGDRHSTTKAEVHHHDFPELHAEGQTAAEAGAHLKHLLDRAFDNAPSDCRREAIAAALHDVEMFLERQETVHSEPTR
jgi:hypothetical protein